MQVEELRRVARQRGWEIVAEHIDDGISGTLASRPALDTMMDGARRGLYDLVVVWKLDRLGRSLQHLLQILDEMERLGVAFVSVTDGAIDTTSSNPQQRLLIQILAAFCQYEAAMIRDRVVAGVRRAQAAGKHCGRPKVEMDLRPALSMLEAGYGLKAISKSLGVSRATLRRRLAEVGEWPRRPPSCELKPERIAPSIKQTCEVLTGGDHLQVVEVHDHQ